MAKVTDQDFEDYINNLGACEILDLIKDYDKFELLKHSARDSTIDAEKERFHEKECYRCDDCRGYFTHSDDLNESDLCPECSDDEETQQEKARQEHSEGQFDG